MKNTLLCKCRALFATPSTKKNTTRFNGFLALFLMVMGMGISWGQISMTSTGSYTQNFDSLPSSGTPTWTNNSTLTNWYSTGFANFVVGTGSANSGALYSFGVAGTNILTERALGSLGSGSATPAYGVVLRNTSGLTITDIKITYTGEQWRNGGVTASQPLAFYYAISPTSITTITTGASGYTSVGALNFTSLVGTTTAATLDGNLASNRTIISNVPIPSLSLANNSYIILKWDDINDSGNDHGLAIDDVTISWTVSPTSTTWDGTAWSNTSGPTTSLDAVIAGNLITSTDLICKDLTINSGSTLTIGAGKKLTVSGNLINNGTLIFKSDASNTALFDVFNGTQSGTGVVTVERYIPAKRAWRAITSPLKGSDTSIFSQWQNNGTVSSGVGIELWNPNGDTTPSSSNSGLAVGPSSSILQYDAGAWNAVTNTNTTNLFTTSRNNAFMVFPTGSYGGGNILSNLPAAATTIKATGQLITGNVTYSNLSNTNHTLIGNPYASPIDLNSILDANATLEKLFWVWDPNGGNQGTYNTFDATANAYTVTNLSYINSTVIQSGQAFFVKALSGQTGSFTISESNKSTASTNTLFRNGTPPELLRVGLYKQINNEWSGRDGAMTVLLSDAAANQSANKMANSTENIAFSKNGVLFASEHHLPLATSDVLNVKVWNTTAGANYKLKINTEAFTTTNLSATLEDLFTNSRTPLNLEGAAIEYPFTVTTDALSTGDRFRIVFQNVVLGTNNPTANGFQIVPNPVTGDSFQVNLGTLATGIYSYSICNAIGQEVEKGTLNNATQNTNYEVKMSNTATGIYIMKIKGNDNTVFTAKIIKK